MTTTETIIRPFEARDREAVIALWRASELVKPQNDPNKDIDRKLKHSPDLFMVAERTGGLIGTVMAGYDGHRGWINYLAVSPKLRCKGVGRRLMNHAEAELLKLGCPKVNLQVRETNEHTIAFYEEIGYSRDGVVSFGKRLVCDE